MATPPVKNHRKIARSGSRGKRPDSAANARPHKVSIQGHGGTSHALMRDPLDLRTRVGKAYRLHMQALTEHVGGSPTTPEQSLIDQAARLRVLAAIAWREVSKKGCFGKEGALLPAVDAFRAAIRDERDVLRMLGIERRAKPLPTLSEYLAGEGDSDAD
jgi:hypothetical protein